MKTLLLSSSYEPVLILTERKLISLLMRGAIDVVMTNDDEKINFSFYNGNFPSVVRLKNSNHNRLHDWKRYFNRNVVFLRDEYSCQYCGKKVHHRDLTIDHVVPKYAGGKNTWSNCVSCCRSCNQKKGSKTLHEAGMSLRKQPTLPKTQHVQIARLGISDINSDLLCKDWLSFIAL
jgi:hypothetical protein